MTTPFPNEDRLPSIPVLSIAMAEDQVALSRVLVSSEAPSCPDARWKIETCGSLRAALRLLRKSRIPIVLCDCDVRPRTWIKMLKQLARLPAPPLLIVTSRTADDYLWAKALNLGAYDVLAKPFNKREVVRALSSAWLHWSEEWEQPVLSAPAYLSF